MKPDTEHQQHDADLRQLGRDIHIGHEIGRSRVYYDACNQIANQCRYLNPLGNESENQGDAETGGNGGNQRNTVTH